jgi:hypothetical protein
MTRSRDVATQGGLVLISSTTIGSAVSSITVNNAFSATYENYLITISGGAGSVSNTLRLTLGATTTGYYSCSVLYIYTSGTSFVNPNNNGANFPYAGAYSANVISMEATLQNPFTSKVTIYRSKSNETVSGGAFYMDGGMLNNTTSYTDFTLTPASGTLTGGTIKVYGYK